MVGARRRGQPSPTLGISPHFILTPCGPKATHPSAAGFLALVPSDPELCLRNQGPYQVPTGSRQRKCLKYIFFPKAGIAQSSPPGTQVCAAPSPSKTRQGHKKYRGLQDQQLPPQWSHPTGSHPSGSHPPGAHPSGVGSLPQRLQAGLSAQEPVNYTVPGVFLLAEGRLSLRSPSWMVAVPFSAAFRSPAACPARRRRHEAEEGSEQREFGGFKSPGCKATVLCWTSCSCVASSL